MSDKVAFLLMQKSDNIGIAIQKISRGETVTDTRNGVSVEAKEDIPFGFKIAVSSIEKDATVYKYGQPIGIATESISVGQLVHVHNIGGLRGRGDL